MPEISVHKSPIVREELARTVLPSGLEVCVLPKRGFGKKYGVLATRYGSIDSKFQVGGSDEIIEVPDGIAHFLEHKLFEEEFGSIDDKFAELGASSNAFTNFTMTGYLFSCTDNFEPALDTLVDFVFRPYFTEQNVEKEKGIIEQEIRMNEDNPDWQCFFDFLKAMYQRHPVRIEIAGTVESINRIDVDTLCKCYRTFYHPSNMALFVVGDVEPENVVDQADRRLAGRDFGPGGPITRIYPEEPPEIGRQRVGRQMPVSEHLVCFGYKDTDVGHEGRTLLRKIVTTEMLMDVLIGRGSDLYNKLYEEGVIDTTFGWDYEAESGFAHVAMSGKTKDPETLVQRVQEGIQALLDKGVDNEAFERSQRRAMGAFIRGFNSLEFIAYNFLTYHFRGMNLLERVEVASEVDADELSKAAEMLFRPERRVVSVVSPGKDVELARGGDR
ncbi:MAG: insulinase family protein [Firmicutes bacterium]|nr:insulinase family protein [Bacillota bacterium]